nr:hypothetical protein CFP56_73185 [Quercus suber]
MPTQAASVIKIKSSSSSIVYDSPGPKTLFLRDDGIPAGVVVAFAALNPPARSLREKGVTCGVKALSLAAAVPFLLRGETYMWSMLSPT